MEQEINKNKKILIILLIIFTIITAILIILNDSKKESKALKEQDYIIEKETNYSKTKGLLPLINLKGKDIEKVNNEIINNYYKAAYKENDTFYYEYSIQKDILSILTIVTYTDDTEYGKIEYYAYNIDIKTNKLLKNEEVLKKFDLDIKKYETKINDRLKVYYGLDNLKEELNYKMYLERLNYDKKNNKVYIKDKNLYVYISISPTQSLTGYKGNINEIKLQ